MKKNELKFSLQYMMINYWCLNSIKAWMYLLLVDRYVLINFISSLSLYRLLCFKISLWDTIIFFKITLSSSLNKITS